MRVVVRQRAQPEDGDAAQHGGPPEQRCSSDAHPAEEATAEDVIARAPSRRMPKLSTAAIALQPTIAPSTRHRTQNRTVRRVESKASARRSCVDIGPVRPFGEISARGNSPLSARGVQQCHKPSPVHSPRVHRALRQSERETSDPTTAAILKAARECDAAWLAEHLDRRGGSFAEALRTAGASGIIAEALDPSSLINLQVPDLSLVRTVTAHLRSVLDGPLSSSSFAEGPMSIDRKSRGRRPPAAQASPAMRRHKQPGRRHTTMPSELSPRCRTDAAPSGLSRVAEGGDASPLVAEKAESMEMGLPDDMQEPVPDASAELKALLCLAKAEVEAATDLGSTFLPAAVASTLAEGEAVALISQLRSHHVLLQRGPQRPAEARVTPPLLHGAIAARLAWHSRSPRRASGTELQGPGRFCRCAASLVPAGCLVLRAKPRDKVRAGAGAVAGQGNAIVLPLTGCSIRLDPTLPDEPLCLKVHVGGTTILAAPGAHAYPQDIYTREIGAATGVEAVEGGTEGRGQSAWAPESSWAPLSFDALACLSFDGGESGAREAHTWHATCALLSVHCARSVLHEVRLTLAWLAHVAVLRSSRAGTSTGGTGVGARRQQLPEELCRLMLHPPPPPPSTSEIEAAAAPLVEDAMRVRHQLSPPPPQAAVGPGPCGTAPCRLALDAEPANTGRRQIPLPAAKHLAATRAKKLASGKKAEGSAEAADESGHRTTLESLAHECVSLQAGLQAACAPSVVRGIATASLSVVRGCMAQLIDLATESTAEVYLRVAPSRSVLLSDRWPPLTLLGALPGLSPAAASVLKQQPKRSRAARGCGLRLVLASSLLEVLAPSCEAAAAWVAGVNALPLGSKQIALAEAASQSHAQASAQPGGPSLLELDPLAVAFRIFDRDGSGAISWDELKTILAATGERRSEEDLRQMIQASDANGDGSIDFGEFRRLMGRGGKYACSK